MFPEISNYNTKDIRSLILYAWHFELFGLRELIESTNNSINEKIKANLDRAQSMIDNWEVYDNSMREVQMYHSISPLAFQSYLLTLYSVVEASIDRYCNICQENMNLKLELDDLQDKGITRGINYLEKVVEIETVKSNYIWGKMTVINDLRNDLIHRCGSVSKKKNINKYCEELGVEVIDGRISITYENIKQIYSYIEQFMELVFTRNFTNSTKTLNKQEGINN